MNVFLLPLLAPYLQIISYTLLFSFWICHIAETNTLSISISPLHQYLAGLGGNTPGEFYNIKRALDYPRTRTTGHAGLIRVLKDRR
jgi:hypothetical protein